MEFDGPMNSGGPGNRGINRIDISRGANRLAACEFDERLAGYVLSHVVEHRRTVRGVAEYLVELAVCNCLHGLRLSCRNGCVSSFRNRKDGFVPRAVAGGLVELIK